MGRASRVVAQLAVVLVVLGAPALRAAAEDPLK